MPTGNNMFASLGSIIASFMFVWAMFQQYIPREIQSYIEKYSQRLITFFYPCIQIKFNEFTGNGLMRSEAFLAIETYLSSNTYMQAKRLKADIVKNSQSLALRMDDHEEVADEFQGVKLSWASGKDTSKSESFSYYPVTVEKRYYKLNFHKKHRDFVLGPYWSDVVFEHPAKFETLAMEPDKKMDIINDLITFSKAEEFYKRIGKAWKRGYLLYGPPGTGKSTLIAQGFISLSAME